jgi:hypothetical protein
MSAQSDPHAELGVLPGATPAEIHQAFRRRLREHHPDTRPEHDDAIDAASDQALQRVLAAYETLRLQAASPAVTEPTPGRQPEPHHNSPTTVWERQQEPPLRATEVHWVRAAESAPSHHGGPGRTSGRVPNLDLLIRWPLGS